MKPGTYFYVLYPWRLHPGQEENFCRWPDQATWKLTATIALPENDSFAKMAASVMGAEPPLELTGLHYLL